MTLEGSVRLWAGLMFVLSLGLYCLVSPYWLLLTAFVGLNLVQSPSTGFFGAEMILKLLLFKNVKSSLGADQLWIPCGIVRAIGWGEPTCRATTTFEKS